MGQATIDVGGNTVTVPVGGEQQADGFTVAVESVTDTEVVVRICGGRAHLRRLRLRRLRVRRPGGMLAP